MIDQMRNWTLVQGQSMEDSEQMGQGSGQSGRCPMGYSGRRGDKGRHGEKREPVTGDVLLYPRLCAMVWDRYSCVASLFLAAALFAVSESGAPVRNGLVKSVKVNRSRSR